MKLLGWEPVLPLAKPMTHRGNAWVDANFAWSGEVGSHAFKEMALGGHHHGYCHPNDARNDAARGVIEALRCLRAYEVFLVAERLK